MNRRELIALVGGALVATPELASAQRDHKIFRIGAVWVADEETVRPYEAAFLAALGERGYVAGRNVHYEGRYARGKIDQIPALVDELLSSSPDVLAGLEQVARVMVRKTSSVPIVIFNSSDPVAAGLVRSLSMPGSNVTGVSFQYNDLPVKHIELMREILPRLKRVGHLLDSNVPGAKLIEETARSAAQSIGASYIAYYVASRTDLENTFALIEADPPDALLGISGSGMLFGLRQMQVDNALRLRVPFSSAVAAFPELGALFSYGPSLVDGFRLAGAYVERILKGAKPAELPVQQPTRFELVVNLKTAQELGLAIPNAVLIRADRLIE